MFCHKNSIEMESKVVLTSHKEKYDYVAKYIISDEDYPLMIIGSGGNGKSIIINEVTNKYFYRNYCIIIPGEPFHFKTHDGAINNQVIIHAWGTEEDFILAKYLNANIVYFEKDPEFD